MKFPKFWCRVHNETGKVVARGWSETSHDEAAANAERRLRRILDFLQDGGRLDEYQYEADGVICEPVIDRVFEGETETAVISRNAYGSLVLNTPHLMIADIDIQPPRLPDFFRRIKTWFGLGRDRPPAEQQKLEHVRQWQRSHPDFSLRVYRTHSGYRVLVINQYWPRVDEQALRLLEQLDSDPLYRRLCKSQSCFRARLSPKPWRVGVPGAPTRFPFRNASEERAFDQWEQKYRQVAEGFSVCRYVETIGKAARHNSLTALIAQHDAWCCGDRPLA